MTMKTDRAIIYVTRDFERAAEVLHATSGAFIVSNFFPSVSLGENERKRVLHIDAPAPLNTAELLERPETITFIKKQKNPAILVFKNTSRIERICKAHGWTLLNPPAELAERIEAKISQVEWLGELKTYLPPSTRVTTCKDIAWQGEPFIMQFNRSHTGSGTHLIDSKQSLEKIKEQFPNRPARVSDYVGGPVLTSNNIVTDDGALVGNISYQITGLAPFTDLPFATIGNDWGFAKTLLKDKQIDAYAKIVRAIAKKLRAEGWKGLFGVDMVLDVATDTLYLIEINARQPASTTYESKLQRTVRKNNAALTVFEAHIESLLGKNLSKQSLVPIEDGAQIILRNSASPITYHLSPIKESLAAEGFHVIEYKNTKPGEDILRIQSTASMMKSHSAFNSIGQKIAESIPVKQPFDIQDTLSRDALAMIDQYLHLNIDGKTMNCPYFNNRRSRVRGGLRVLIGKGTPKEIAEEAELIAMRKKIDLASLSERELKHFLVDSNLGIDCSALAYYLLNKELAARGKGGIKKYLHFPFVKNPIRKLLTRLRTVENTGVKTLAHETNSTTVGLADVRPGDMITMIASKGTGAPDHVVLIHAVEKEKNKPKALHYTHALKWSTDGQYNHGVRQGRIDVTNPDKHMLEQTWIEQEKTGDENETYARAKTAKQLDLRRLKPLAQ